MTFIESNPPKTSSVLGDTAEAPRLAGATPTASGQPDGGSDFDGWDRAGPSRRTLLLALTAVVVAVTVICALVVVTYGSDDPEQSIDHVGDVGRVVAGDSEQSVLSGSVDTLSPLRVDGVPVGAYSSDVTIGSSTVDADGTVNNNFNDATSSTGSQNQSADTTSSSTLLGEVGGAGAGAGNGTDDPTTTQKPDQTTTSDPSTTAKPSTSSQTTAKPTTSTKPATTSQTTAKPTTSQTTAKPTTSATTAKPTTSQTTAKPTTTAAPTTAAPTTSSPSSGKLLWEDNFNSFDSSTWKVEHSTYGDSNNELQCYRPENVSVANGMLTLRAVTETYTCPNGSTREVTSGMIRSRGVTFSPGQALEFRVKLNPADPDDQSGLWPAVWSSSWAGGGWPRGGELDYLEVMTAENPNRAMFSMHYADESNRHKLQNKGVIGSEYFSNSWHTIRFEYGYGGSLVWYLDGVESFRVNSAATLQGYPAPFDQSIGEIKINLALGGRPGPLSPSAVGSAGASFQVDYIRIYQL